jgi:outer membrane protein assembly factor BamE (lipoprotein component of BamABCDE complex)
MTLIGRAMAMGILTTLLGALGACDWLAQQELKPGQSTADDVRRLMGKPDMIWEENDGTQFLEFPRAPEGSETLVVEIGPDGKYRATRNILVPENFARVAPGMSRDDVRRLLGRPGETARFAPKPDEEVWSWRYRGGVDTEIFDVYFGGDGRVLRTGKSQDPKSMNAR